MINGLTRGSTLAGHDLQQVTRSGLWALAAVTLFGALLRFTTLGDQSFWYDEADTHNVVAQGLGAALSRVPQSELNPPLYYALLWGWARVFGLSEIGLRSFSAVCGTAMVPVMWALGRQIMSHRVGMMAALLTAVNPLMFWYSQEARNYALLTLLTALALLALLRVMRMPTKGRIALWALACSLALCTHYFAAFMIVPQVGILLWISRTDQRLTRSKLVLGMAPVAGMALLLLPLAAHQNRADTATFIEDSGSLSSRVARLVKEDVVGYGGVVESVAFAVVAILLILLAVVTCLGGRRARHTAMLLCAMGGAAIVTASLPAAVGSDYVSTRNLMATWPVFALVVAVGLGATRFTRVGTLGLIAFAMLSMGCVSTVVLNTETQRSDWRGAASGVGPATAHRAIVSYDVAAESLRPYMAGLTRFPASGSEIREIVVISLREPWLGTRQQRLRPARPLPGFTLIEKIETPTYTVIRYQASALRLVRRIKVQTLYPDLPNRLVLLQFPNRDG